MLGVRTREGSLCSWAQPYSTRLTCASTAALGSNCCRSVAQSGCCEEILVLGAKKLPASHTTVCVADKAAQAVSRTVNAAACYVALKAGGVESSCTRALAGKASRAKVCEFAFAAEEG